MIRMVPEYHRSNAGGPTISVEISDDRAVVLAIESEPGETFDDRDVDRTFTPEEARALAAMLWHFAEMAER